MFSPAPIQLSDYRLLGLVGQGQFAQVYSAIHRRTGKIVAIKKIRHAATQADQEALILARISPPKPTHRNLVSAQAIFHRSTGYQFVLDYCESGTLRSHLNATLAAPLPLSETKSLVADILHGLSHLHQQGIIHNDLKPENILLTLTPSSSYPPISLSSLCTSPPLTAKIADFGHAQLIPSRPLPLSEIGSPTYAAPERFSGQSSTASDLYAVGIILYEMLLGDRPFSGDPDTLRQAHQIQPIPLPERLTPAARHLLTTALHKQPHQRFANADTMLIDLQQLDAVVHRSSPITLKAAPTIALEQTLVPLPIANITEPIEQLISIPQGCCLATEKSLHILTEPHQILPLAHLKQSSWISIAPNGHWFITLPKQSSRAEDSLYRRVNILAIDNRYLIRIQTSTQSPKTYLECFTRKGRFIGMISLNLVITQITLTATPYQLLALSRFPNTTNSTNSAKICDNQVADTAVLIQIKPFQIQYLRLPIVPTQVSALPWGYAIADDEQILLLDREASPIACLQGLPPAAGLTERLKKPRGEVTSRQRWQVAALSTARQHQDTLVLASTTAANWQTELFRLDLKTLDLDLIF